MKGFRKLSSIALLLCAFVYPPSLAEAKDISLSNVHNEQSAAPEANLVGDKTGELLIAQRRPGRYRNFRRRQIIRRQERFRRYENIRRRERFGGYDNIRRRERFGGYDNIRRRY
ncbi:hypothetical protein [uncultured Nostoc sp.]|uniref:hypothetical protein n=1 Tax=uncultured Nostoc sp. TaxID=340711 RepID=UPI0035C9F6C2